MYKIKLIKEDEPVATKKKAEIMLRDLLEVMPTLRKHKLDAEIQTKVKTLRSGRKQKHYSLELSRRFAVPDKAEATLDEEGMVISRKKNYVDFKAVGQLTQAILRGKDGRTQTHLLKELKEQIKCKIQTTRLESLPPVENYPMRHGVIAKKLAEVYLESGVFLKLQMKKVRADMSQAKTPKTKDRYVGVELEFASQQDKEFICDRLFEAGVAKYVHVKRDGSIQVDEQHPHQIEITVLATEKEIFGVVDRICNALNQKCKVKVDKSCGLHVHVDMRHRSPEIPFVNLVAMQHFLYAMVPANRKTGRYSVPVPNRNWHVTEGHYFGVNSDAYQRHNTLELRMHCGTTQARKINNWISLILAIANAPKITESPASTQELQALTNITDDLRKYVESRIAKFASQHKKTKNPEWLTAPAEVESAADTESVAEQSEVA